MAGHCTVLETSSGPIVGSLTLSSTEVARIHAFTVILCWLGVPLLRFHPHPSYSMSKDGSLRSPHHGHGLGLSCLRIFTSSLGERILVC